MQCLIIEVNKGDGDFHEIVLKDIVEFRPENKVSLQHYKYPRDVIWAELANLPPFPIANFNSRGQRDLMFKAINTLDRIRYTQMYERIFTDEGAFEFLRDYLHIQDYRKYFRIALKNMPGEKYILERDVFVSCNMSYPDIVRLGNGQIVPKSSLPSIDNLQRSLKVPANIIHAGVTPEQFFTYIINETYNDTFAV